MAKLSEFQDEARRLPFLRSICACAIKHGQNNEDDVVWNRQHFFAEFIYL